MYHDYNYHRINTQNRKLNMIIQIFLDILQLFVNFLGIDLEFTSDRNKFFLMNYAYIIAHIKRNSVDRGPIFPNIEGLVIGLRGELPMDNYLMRARS